MVLASIVLFNDNVLHATVLCNNMDCVVALLLLKIGDVQLQDSTIIGL
jgi:hypothetical protein